jgi:hypothetical protein
MAAGNGDQKDYPLWEDPFNISKKYPLWDDKNGLGTEKESRS